MMSVRDFASLVRAKWGDEFFQPDPGYEFGNGRVFKDTGKYGGIYVIETTDTAVHRAINAGNIGTAQEGFLISGIAVELIKGKAIGAELGSFSIAGIDATVSQGPGFSSDLGSFSVTGIDANFYLNLRRVVGSVQSYAVTGVDATLTKGNVSKGSLSADMGSFSVTGNDIFLSK